MLKTKLIGGKIAEARKKMNLSQAQLAQRLFISPQAVGKWERGESFPDILTFSRLAQIFGVDLNYFSENFPSVAPDSESLRMPSDEPMPSAMPLPSEKQQRKLGWDMSRGNWTDADFSGLKNLQDKFSSSNIQRCRFIGSDLSGLLLKSNNIDRCDFSRSDLSNSHIQNSNLGHSVFSECALKAAEFSGSNLDGCDFSGADLSGTTFSGSFVMGCDFTGADFSEALFKAGGFEHNPIAQAVWNRTTFEAMYIANVVFEGTLEECAFQNCAFKKVTFQNATLTNTFFKNKSLKQLRFVDCQVDRMTYAFLKNGKADLSGVTLLAT